MKLKRMNNLSGSYTTQDGKYEIVNFSKEFGGVSEWRVIDQETLETVFIADTLREVREYLATS